MLFSNGEARKEVYVDNKVTIRSFIQESNWFNDIPEYLLDELVSVSKIIELPANYYVWTLGEQTSSVYGVLSGCVRTAISSTMGHEFAINDCDMGAWLGAPCLVTDGGRVIEAKTLTATSLIVIRRQYMLSLADRWPLLYRNLMRHNVEESRGLYVLLTGMAFYPLSARVAGRIVELARERGNTVANGISLTSKLSQNDYAQMAVGSRQRVNKIFRDWEKDGLIEQQGDALLILDLEGLKKQIVPFD